VDKRRLITGVGLMSETRRLMTRVSCIELLSLILVVLLPSNARHLRHSESSPLTINYSECPRPCFCHSISRVVQCSRRGLRHVPTSLPDSTLQLNLNGNTFRNAFLRRSNFTGKYLFYIVQCAGALNNLSSSNRPK